jgi:hypothetical protein
MKLSSTITFALLAILTPSLAFPISLNQAAVDELVNVKRAVTSFGEALFDKRSPGASVSSALEGLSDSSSSSRIDSNWAHEPNNQMLPKRSPRASIDKALEDLSGSDHSIDPNWAHEPGNTIFSK